RRLALRDLHLVEERLRHEREAAGDVRVLVRARDRLGRGVLVEAELGVEALQLLVEVVGVDVDLALHVREEALDRVDRAEARLRAREALAAEVARGDLLLELVVEELDRLEELVDEAREEGRGADLEERRAVVLGEDPR